MRRLRLVFVAGVIALLLAYTLAAYTVACAVYEGPEVGIAWRSTPPGSFFPIPQMPGMLTALSGMSLLDQAIYLIFIKTGLLPAIDILAVAIVAMALARGRRQPKG